MVFQKYYAALVAVFLCVTAVTCNAQTVVKRDVDWEGYNELDNRYQIRGLFGFDPRTGLMPDGFTTGYNDVTYQPYPLRPSSYPAEKWGDGATHDESWYESTILGELVAIRLEATKSAGVAEGIVQILAFIAGMIGWQTFARNIHV